MKKRRYLSTVVAIVVLLALAGVAAAFGMGNVDGRWQYVEDNSTSGAYCDTWGTGNGTSETARSSTSTNIQGALGGTDENQVHYGRPSSTSNSCPTSEDPGSTWFDGQSGLGFDGNNNVGTNLAEGTEFWLGRLTHYNRPITFEGTPNFMDWIDIDIQVAGILCGNGQPPNEGSTLTFTYRVNFVETPNAGSGDSCGYDVGCNCYTYQCPYTTGTDTLCPYDDGINSGGCADRVQIGTQPPSASFTCDDENEPVEGIYTITLLGFQPHESTDCSTQTYTPSLVTNNFVTRETTQNNACLWAQISDFVPTAVELKSFTATAAKKSVVLAWETTSEVDNLGFNLYRAETAGGEQIRLNQEIIPSNVYPGSPAGAVYSYTDEAVYLGRTYTYWLEDVDIYRNAEMHGPVEVTVGGKALLPKAKGLSPNKPAGGKTTDGGQTW